MSRTTLALAGLIVIGAAALAAWNVPQAGDAAVLLRAAIEKEEVDGNLEAAIEQYKQIIKIAGVSRTVAAQALLRLGGCYEKRGPEEARRAYEQLIRDYGEQSQEVSAARQRLAALAGGAPVPARDPRLTIRRVPNLDMYARPSPDGKHLAFTDWESGNLAIRDLATGATRALTKDGSLGESSRFAGFSAWSHDSRRIAFTWTVQEVKAGRSELRVVSLEADTPPETVAIPVARWIQPLDWSPDGSRILCSYGQEGTRVLSHALVAVGGGAAADKLQLPVSGWLEYRFAMEGQAVLYSASAGDRAGPHDIFLRNLKTGESTPVIQHPAEDLLVGVLPGMDWLLFASDRRGRLDLWAVPFRDGKADGQPVLVKQGLGRFLPLGFTKDGRYYYATLSATDDVFLADFDLGTGGVIGEARKVASRWDGVSSSPSFSPDGGRLAYVVKRGPNPLPLHIADSLVVESLTNPTAEPLVAGFEEFGLEGVTDPCWLPDGKSVVVDGFRDQEQESALYRVDLPDLRKTKVYSATPGRRLTSHACASDGRFIYVGLVLRDSGQTGGQTDEITRIDLADGTERNVFRAPQGQRISSYSIALSPDGRTLSIVTRLDRYRRALLVMPSEGGTPRQIDEFRQPSGGGVAHVWSPDGRSVLYVQGAENRTAFLRSVRADGGGAGPEAIFKSTLQFFDLKFHPTGRLLAFTGRPTASSSSEVWAIENLREELKMMGGGKVR